MQTPIAGKGLAGPSPRSAYFNKRRANDMRPCQGTVQGKGRARTLQLGVHHPVWPDWPKRACVGQGAGGDTEVDWEGREGAGGSDGRHQQSGLGRGFKNGKY